MAGGFQRAVWTVLFGDVIAAAAVLLISPRARETARPYLVKGLRKVMELGEEMKGMVDEARVEANRLLREIEAERAATGQH